MKWNGKAREERYGVGRKPGSERERSYIRTYVRNDGKTPVRKELNTKIGIKMEKKDKRGNKHV